MTAAKIDNLVLVKDQLFGRIHRERTNRPAGPVRAWIQWQLGINLVR